MIITVSRDTDIGQSYLQTLAHGCLIFVLLLASDPGKGIINDLFLTAQAYPYIIVAIAAKDPAGRDK